MIIKSIALINLVGIFLFGLILPAEIHISQDLPAMMTAGSEVKVTLTVEKGDLSGFAKLQIDLPEGLSAASIETKGASFTFADGKAKFIWMAMPAQPKFSVSYTLKADATASGTHAINGKLSYIEENERKTHDLSTAMIEVTGGTVAQAPAGTSTTTTEAAPIAEATPQPTAPTTTPDASNDIVSAAGAAPVDVPVIENRPENPAPPKPALKIVTAQQGAGNVGATRTITAITETEMVVEVNISKGDLRGFGKLQETIPAGFTALEKSSDEAIFTTQGTIVKFVWLNLPARNQLKVVYKLRGNGQPEGGYVVNGEFGYLLNDETQKAVIGSTEFTIGPAALAQSQPAQTQETATTDTGSSGNQPTTQGSTQGGTSQAGTTTAQVPAPKPKPSTSNRIPAPETGVTYKVQITAAHKEVGPEYFAERHRFMGQFGIERHEGWIKYTTGRFGGYREARDQRQAYVDAGHNFPGPFVTAYNNGDRITVQEALMLSQQRWVP